MGSLSDRRCFPACTANRRRRCSGGARIACDCVGAHSSRSGPRQARLADCGRHVRPRRYPCHAGALPRRTACRHTARHRGVAHLRVRLYRVVNCARVPWSPRMDPCQGASCQRRLPAHSGRLGLVLLRGGPVYQLVPPLKKVLPRTWPQRAAAGMVGSWRRCSGPFRGRSAGQAAEHRVRRAATPGSQLPMFHVRVSLPSVALGYA